MIVETYSSDETYKIGKSIGEKVKKGQVYCLIGDLGVGKTIFSKGFADGLDIKEDISSPTFTIVNEYDDGRIKFYHFDVYRIADVEEMHEIGFDEYIFGEGVCLIEWANIIEEIIPDNAIWIKIEKKLDKGFDYRQIAIGEKNNK